MSEQGQTIEGRLVAVTGKSMVAGVEVWLAYRTTDGREATERTLSAETGEFAFPLPEEPLEQAHVGAELEGVAPIDLEPAGERLEPGDLTLLIDDIVPSHLRYGGA